MLSTAVPVRGTDRGWRVQHGGMDAWGTALALAARQHGCLATWQVREEVGVGMATFHRRVVREGWTSPWPGVWSPPGHRRGRLHELSAALLAAGPDALVTGRDALWLHGCRVDLDRLIRLTTPMSSHAPRILGPAVKLISSRTLRAHDATHRRRLAVVTPARAFVDLVIPPTPGLVDVRDLLVTARQARLVTIHDMEQALRAARGVPGLPILRRAVDDILAVDADSPFSDRVHRRLRRDGYRPDQAPATIDVGGRVLHPDITFSRQRVAMECDSMLAHSEQRALMIDGRKDRAYRRQGWEPIRIGPFEYGHDWAGFTRDLDDLLGA